MRIPSGQFFAFAALLLLTRVALAGEHDEMTPILLSVHDAPVPFTGSDTRTHLVYELWMTNFSSADAMIERLQILGDDVILQDLDAAGIASRLQPAGMRSSAGTLAKGAQGILFVHLTLEAGMKVPRQLTHRVTAHLPAAPPDHQQITTEGAPAKPDRRVVARLQPPLLGDGYLSADSCCDAARHTRAALPVDGRVWISQRFAVDWEQLDASGRIYLGPREDPSSYTIFGKQVFAVADAVVESAVDRFEEQTPGKYPVNISLEEADGNFVILDLGGDRYALYAHLKPGSVTVHRGDRVHAGQVLGLVGNTGNSVAPHLHFQLMSGKSTFASNGLPYELEDFRITGRSPGTELFDKAEAEGTALAITPVAPAQHVERGLPLDQLVISFRRDPQAASYNVAHPIRAIPTP